MRLLQMAPTKAFRAFLPVSSTLLLLSHELASYPNTKSVCTFTIFCTGSTSIFTHSFPELARPTIVTKEILIVQSSDLVENLHSLTPDVGGSDSLSESRELNIQGEAQCSENQKTMTHNEPKSTLIFNIFFYERIKTQTMYCMQQYICVRSMVCVFQVCQITGLPFEVQIYVMMILSQTRVCLYCGL